jgi:autotransporter-associated beta strand protein
MTRSVQVFIGTVGLLVLAAVQVPAGAATLYWGGFGWDSWDAPGAWDTDPNGFGGPPAAVPGAGDVAVFGINGQNADTSLSLDNKQSAAGLVFNTAGAVTINPDWTGNPGYCTLALGGSGMVTNAGAGPATINTRLLIGNSVGAFNTAAGTTLTLNQAITGTGANLQKTGLGTLVVNGDLWNSSDTWNEQISVGSGALNVANNSVRTSAIFVNSTSAAGATMRLTNSNVYVDGTNDWGCLLVGYNAGSGVNAFNMSGGSLTTHYGGVVQGINGGGVRSIATFDGGAAVNLTGGSAWYTGDNGGQHGSQSAVIRSGTVTLDASSDIELGIVGGFNVFDQVGGTVTAPKSDGTAAWTGMSHAGGINLQFRMSKSDNFAIYNLGSAATLVTGSIVSGDGTPYLSQNNAYLNLHGGTLKPATNQANFIRTSLTGTNAAQAAPQAIVYSEGAVIDTDGHSITIRQPLRAPAGNGVPATTIPVSTANQGSGYTTTPIVYVTTNAAAEPSSGCANGATALANMVDDGTGHGTFKLASITITNPGQNFTATPVLSLRGGSPTAAADLSSITLATTPNVSGGLTKKGAGTLTLSAASTYTGPTVINGGTLALGVGGSIDASSMISIAGNAVFDVSALSAYSLAQTLAAKGAGTATVVGGLQGNVTVDGKTVDLQDGVNIGTLAVSGSLAITGSTLRLDLGPDGTCDRIDVSDYVYPGGGINTIDVAPLGNLTSLAAGDYTLMTSSSGYDETFVLAQSTLTVGGTIYGLSLSSLPWTEVLTVTPLAVPEPASLWLAATALTATASWPRRRSQRPSAAPGSTGALASPGPTQAA